MSTVVSLVEMIKAQLASDDLRLPVFSASALELQDMLSTDDVDLDVVAQKLQLDQALASQVLREANSAFYGGLKQIGTIKESIMRLGTKEVLNLVLLMTQRQQYGSSDKFLGPYVKTLWKHASSCAMGSKWLAKRLGHSDIAQEAFMAGLLHDIGHLFLLKVLENIQVSRNGEIALSESAFEEVMENMHAAQGSMLLQRWNLPKLYCDAAALHHNVDYDFSNTVITIVRLVDLTCYKLGIGLHQEASLELATYPEVKALQVSELLLAELEIILEDSMESFE
jgi:HD-like signal output (HDOD) protein